MAVAGHGEHELLPVEDDIEIRTAQAQGAAHKAPGEDLSGDGDPLCPARVVPEDLPQPGGGGRLGAEAQGVGQLLGGEDRLGDQVRHALRGLGARDADEIGLGGPHRGAVLREALGACVKYGLDDLPAVDQDLSVRGVCRRLHRGPVFIVVRSPEGPEFLLRLIGETAAAVRADIRVPVAMGGQYIAADGHRLGLQGLGAVADGHLRRHRPGEILRQGDGHGPLLREEGEGGLRVGTGGLGRRRQTPEQNEQRRQQGGPNQKLGQTNSLSGSHDDSSVT